MLKDIFSVPGKPGLYRLVSAGNNFSIFESLTDKKRLPLYQSDKPSSLDSIHMFTEEGEIQLSEVLTKIQDKEDGKTVSINFSKAGNDELRAYFAEVLPNFDRDRVYPTDIKKLLKWYDLLISNGITVFTKKEDEETSVVEADKDSENTPHTSKSVVTKHKEAASIQAVKAAKTPSATSAPKNPIPKKSVVGSKRGS